MGKDSIARRSGHAISLVIAEMPKQVWNGPKGGDGRIASSAA